MITNNKNRHLTDEANFRTPKRLNNAGETKYRNALKYYILGRGVNRIHDFDIKYLYGETIYITCNTFICTILFGLFESSKITLFKDLVKKIIETKV